MQTQSAVIADQAAQADDDRTKRLFIGFLTSALGVDQTMNGEDASPASQTGQFTYANPDGTASVQGQPVSNLQGITSAVAGIPPGFLLLAGIVFWLLKR